MSAATSASEPAGGEPATGRTSRSRSIGTIALVVLTVILLVASTLALWVRATMFDTERFMEIVEPTLTSQEVSAAVSTYLADQIIEALDIEARLESRLSSVDVFIGESLSGLDLGPTARRLLAGADVPLFAGLADAIAAGIEDRIRAATDGFVASDVYQVALPAAVERGHQALVALLRDDLDSLENVAIVDGEVQWNLVPLIARVINEVVTAVLDGLGIEIESVVALAESEPAQAAIGQLGASLDTELPSDFGQVTIVSEAELNNWQDTVQGLDRLVWLLIGVTMLLAALAIWASQRRRRTIIQLAFGSAFGLMLVVFAQEEATDAVEAAVEDPVVGNATRAFLDSVGASLRVITFAIIAVAAVIGVTTFLASKPGWLGTYGGGGRFENSIHDHPDGWRIGGYVAALVLWFVLGISVVTLLVVAILLGVYLAWLAEVRRSGRRQEEMLTKQSSGM